MCTAIRWIAVVVVGLFVTQSAGLEGVAEQKFKRKERDKCKKIKRG